MKREPVFTRADMRRALGAAIDALHADAFGRDAECDCGQALEVLAGEFVRYWTTDRTPDGCGMCGGIPHSTTYYVGRMAAMLGSVSDSSPEPSDSTRRSEAK